MTRIVVGIDGSESSRRALEFALEEAELRDATVDAVCAYPYPAAAWGIVEPGLVPLPDTGELRRHAEAVLDRVLSEQPTDVPVERLVAEGSPAHILLETATGADLLVVGSRGLGGVRGLLLGSVSRQVVGRAHCPIVVIPPPGEEEGDE